MPIENMQIVSSDGAREGQKIVRLKGPLSIHTVYEFQTAIRSETAPTLIMDFSEVPFIDSSGLGALVGAYVAAQKNNRKLALVGLSTQAKALLEMTKVSQFFPAYASTEAAEAASA
jgi:anti-sigma B factor antagonist